MNRRPSQSQPSPSPETTGRRRRNTQDAIPDDSSAPTPKRQMVSRACDVCKQRKAKCSGTLPCTYCSRKGQECLYETRYARGRPPTPERISESSGPARRPVTNQSVSGHTRTQSRQSHTSRPPPAQPAAPDGRLPPSRASPVLGVTEIQGQYVEPTSGMAFLHRAWKRISRRRPGGTIPGESGPSPRMSGDVDERRQRQDCAGDKPWQPATATETVLPPLLVCHQLVAYYHDVCVATYRFLHRPSVEQWLDTVHANVSANKSIQSGLNEMKAAVVLAVLAVAMFHRGRDSGEDEEAVAADSDRLFLWSARLVEAATGYPALDSVQARLVQVLYLLHTSRLNQAWYVFGQTLQVVAALGLHRADRKHAGTKKVDYVDVQCRRRCFWVAYILDAYLGIMFGRPRHFHDENIDQALPDAVNDEDMTTGGRREDINGRPGRECTSESLIFHARIGRIVGRISQTVYAIHQNGAREPLEQTVSQIRGDLDAWAASLPAILNAVHPSSLVYPFRRQAMTMRLARAHATIHLNRPFLLRQSETSTTVSTAVSDCLSAARDVLEMVDGMAQDGTLFYAFWWTHYVAFCSLTVVYVWEIQRQRTSTTTSAPTGLATANNGPTTEVSSPTLSLAEACLGHLAKATARNSPSRRYSIILEELRQEALSNQPNHQQTQTQQHAPVPYVDMGQDMINVQVDVNNYNNVNDPNHNPGVDNFNLFSEWDAWQTINWLDIDSLALGPISGMAASPESWMSGSLPMGFS